MHAQQMRLRVFQIIEKAETDDLWSRVFDLFIVTLIMLNVVAVVLSSYASVSKIYGSLFDVFELVSVIIFTIEYGLRLWTAQFKYPQLGAASAVFRYLISFMALVDLAAILPFYLPMLFPFDLRFLRILRVTRIMRILKVHRYTESLQMIARVLKSRAQDLIVTVFITSLLLLLASSVMYYLENEAQPSQFPNIVASFWWAIATLTTVGYGDVYPVTVGGKIISGIIAVLGIGLVALPTGIISSGFLDELQRKRSKRIVPVVSCPHCGRALESEDRQT